MIELRGQQVDTLAMVKKAHAESMALYEEVYADYLIAKVISTQEAGDVSKASSYAHDRADEARRHKFNEVIVREIQAFDRATMQEVK